MSAKNLPVHCKCQEILLSCL